MMGRCTREVSLVVVSVEEGGREWVGMARRESHGFGEGVSVGEG